MIKGKTSTGFAYAVPDSIKDDWAVVEALALIESEDEGEQLRGTVAIVNAILGRDKKRLLKHVRTEEGIVPHSAVMREIGEILRAAGTRDKDLGN